MQLPFDRRGHCFMSVVLALCAVDFQGAFFTILSEVQGSF